MSNHIENILIGEDANVMSNRALELAGITRVSEGTPELPITEAAKGKFTTELKGFDKKYWGNPDSDIKHALMSEQHIETLLDNGYDVKVTVEVSKK